MEQAVAGYRWSDLGHWSRRSRTGRLIDIAITHGVASGLRPGAPNQRVSGQSAAPTDPPLALAAVMGRAGFAGRDFSQKRKGGSGDFPSPAANVLCQHRGDIRVRATRQDLLFIIQKVIALSPLVLIGGHFVVCRPPVLGPLGDPCSPPSNKSFHQWHVPKAYPAAVNQTTRPAAVQDLLRTEYYRYSNKKLTNDDSTHR